MTQLTIYLLPLRSFLQKHHPVLFIATVILFLAYIVFSLYEVTELTEPSAGSSNTSSIAGFDQATVEKIKNLHSSTDGNDTLTLPSPRANPFVE